MALMIAWRPILMGRSVMEIQSKHSAKGAESRLIPSESIVNSYWPHVSFLPGYFQFDLCELYGIRRRLLAWSDEDTSPASVDSDDVL